MEKNYQILTFWDGYNDIYRLPDDKFTKSMQYMYEENELLRYKIKKVKRLSDSKKFEIGDYLGGFTIKEFKIVDNRLNIILE